MSNNNTTDDEFQMILVIIAGVIAFIAWIITLFIPHDYTKEREEAMQEVAKQALSAQHEAYGDFRGDKIHAGFERGEYQNTSHVVCGEHSTVRYDVNKSKVAGAYVGEKGREFFKGLVGAESTKHEPEPEEKRNEGFFKNFLNRNDEEKK